MEDTIAKCRGFGFDDKDIIVDAIMCFDDKYEVEEWPESLLNYKTAYEMFQRRTEMDDFNYYYEDVVRVVPGFKNVNFRHLITTNQFLTEYINLPLYMTKQDIKDQINVGYEDAKASLDVYFEKHPEAERTGQQIYGPRTELWQLNN